MALFYLQSQQLKKKTKKQLRYLWSFILPSFMHISFRLETAALLTACHSTEWPLVFTQVGLSFLFFVYIGYALYTQTHRHTQTHLWVFIHFLAICPGDLSRGRWAVTLTLILLPFLCCILFDRKDYRAVSKVTQLHRHGNLSKNKDLSLYSEVCGFTYCPPD